MNLTSEERNQKYLAALEAAREEYLEVENQVKKLGKRLRSLRLSIIGLSELTETKHNLFTTGGGTIVITDETRMIHKIGAK